MLRGEGEDFNVLPIPGIGSKIESTINAGGVVGQVAARAYHAKQEIRLASGVKTFLSCRRCAVVGVLSCVLPIPGIGSKPESNVNAGGGGDFDLCGRVT